MTLYVKVGVRGYQHSTNLTGSAGWALGQIWKVEVGLTYVSHQTKLCFNVERHMSINKPRWVERN